MAKFKPAANHSVSLINLGILIVNVKTRRALLQLGWTMVESYCLSVWKNTYWRKLDYRCLETNDTDSGDQESTLIDVMVLDGSRMLALKGGFIR